MSLSHSLSLTNESMPNSFPWFQSFIAIPQDFKELLLNCGFNNNLEHFLRFRLDHLGNCFIAHI